MPDEKPDEITEPTDETTDETAGTEGQEPEETDEVPAEVLREKLTAANAEAANYRTKLRQAQEQLQNAKTVEEFESARTELTARITELETGILVRDIAAEHKLTPELAEVITDLAAAGKSPEELKVRAAALAKLLPVEDPAPGKLGGGLNPSGGDPDGDLNPRELRARYARRRR